MLLFDKCVVLQEAISVSVLTICAW